MSQLDTLVCASLFVFENSYNANNIKLLISWVDHDLTANKGTRIEIWGWGNEGPEIFND